MNRLKELFETFAQECNQLPVLQLTPSKVPPRTYMDYETEACWLSFKAGAEKVLKQREELLAALDHITTRTNIGEIYGIANEAVAKAEVQ